MAPTPDLDPGIAALLAGLPGNASSVPGASGTASAAAPGAPQADPSAGGGTLQFGSANTGIPIPQWLNRGLAGAGQGMTDLVRHAGNLVGLESNQDLANAKALDAPLMATTAGKVGNFLGTTAAMAPLGMGVGAGLGKLGALGARLAASPLASGAVQGATQGALLADPGQRLTGAALGGATGALLPAAGGAIGTMARGIARSPEAQTLIDAGVKGLTPGQLNPTGVANRMEQALEGTPLVGDAIQGARENAMKSYTRAMVQRSMAPGATLPDSAQSIGDMVDAAAKSFGPAYDAGKGFPVGPKIMNQIGPDVPLSDALKSVVSRAQPGITPQEQTAVGKNLQGLLSQTIKDAKQSGGMQSDDLLAFRSQLRDLIRGEPATDNASRARLAIYKGAADKVTQALNSQLPQDATDAVNAADQQYGKFIVIQNAAKAAKDSGHITPFQMSTAIAKATPGTVYARGGGANRDLSQAAMDTFQSNVPRTGLSGAGRLALPALAAYAGKGLAMAHPVGAAIAGAPLAGMAALTLTPMGRAAAAGQTGLQQAMAGGLNRLTGAIPQNVANLPGLYGRAALMASLAPRLQQMQPAQPVPQP